MLGYGYCNMFLRTRFNIYYVNIVQLLVLKNIQVLVHQPKQDSITFPRGKRKKKKQFSSLFLILQYQRQNGSQRRDN